MAKPKRFFLERLDNDGHPANLVDEVDEFVFDSRQHIIQSNGNPRYSPSHMVIFDDGTFKMEFEGPAVMLSHFTRLLGITGSQGITQFCNKPESVIVGRKNRKPVLYNTVDKTTWKKV